MTVYNYEIREKHEYRFQVSGALCDGIDLQSCAAALTPHLLRFAEDRRCELV